MATREEEVKDWRYAKSASHLYQVYGGLGRVRGVY